MSVSSLEDLQGRQIFIYKRSAAQQFQHQLPDTDIPRIKKQISKGISVRFCNIFNCGCTPPAGEICCENFKYDFLRKRCRRLV
ncbi:uncharacterized protein TNCT_113661 [Trichonephila clavata]|uniref:Uncharacterized protein n=1 Tax=Trichonephila clavata TaxID=2740835 RepID=A0A8X6FHR9_TRICU|nr:uncharacterized protein TNCT_113661 [Trichonephila clavata]